MTNLSVLYHVADDGVATITLNRPDAHNALTDAFVDDLVAVLERARDDPAARALVLISARETTFCAGGSLSAHLADHPLVEKHLQKARFPRLFSLMRGLGKPIIAAVGGHCLAGGLGLALACDLIIATDRATFGTPEIDVGLLPFIIMPLLVRNAGAKHVLQLVLLGEPVSAARAERLGFVNRLVAPGHLEPAATEWARRLAAKSPLLLRLGKNAFYRLEDLSFDDGQELMLANLMLAFSTDDMHEGIAAFFERRPARWSGR